MRRRGAVMCECTEMHEGDTPWARPDVRGRWAWLGSFARSGIGISVPFVLGDAGHTITGDHAADGRGDDGE